MQKTGGDVTFGGSVAYCAQTAWIRVHIHLCASAINDLRESRRMIQFARTFCLAPHTMRNVTDPRFVTVAYSQISRSSRELVVLLLRLQRVLTTGQGTEI